jgi:hypothetical protein
MAMVASCWWSSAGVEAGNGNTLMGLVLLQVWVVRGFKIWGNVTFRSLNMPTSYRHIE